MRGWLIALGVLLLPGLTRGQTMQVPTLSLDGAGSVLHAAEEKAQQLTAPSSLAVVNPAGDLILFEQMQGGVPIRVGGAVVGAVGVSGFDKANDIEIAEAAAAAVK